MKSIVLAFSMAHGSRLINRDYTGYSQDCREKIQEIHEHSSENWEITSSRGAKQQIYQKRNCPTAETTYDVIFCTRVCVLEEGAPCVVTTQPGYDRCDQDLTCSPLPLGDGNVCQYPTDMQYLYDDSSSWSSNDMDFGDNSSDDWFYKKSDSNDWEK